VDGLVYASSMVMFDSAWRKVPVPAVARWLLGLGIAAALRLTWRGWGHGLIDGLAWPPALPADEHSRRRL
jgi:hypothetical protein